MTKYEQMLEQAKEEDVTVYENYDFSETRITGLYCDGSIALNKNIDTYAEKACVLAEELGHHYTAVGNITNQSDTVNRKQELRGRLIAYNKLIGLSGIIHAYKNHCQGMSEIADYLNVTVEFLAEALVCYKSKYGLYTIIDHYTIYFEPLGILELY